MERAHALKYLRVMATQRCNLGCFFCHREGQLQDSLQEMTPREIAQVTKIAAKFGVWKVKITGGEPLLRRDATDIISEITQIPQIRQVSLVTNGVLLPRRAQEIKNAGLDFVAVSIPTLDHKKYKEITGADCLDIVLKGISAARDAGLQVVLNVVLLNEVNITEIPALIELAKKSKAIIKFIELLTLPSDALRLNKYHYDPELLVQELSQISVSREGWATGGRPKAHSHFDLENGVEAMVFRYPCNTRSCERCTEVYDGLRLTADGRLGSCMLRDDNHADIGLAMRNGVTEQDLERVFLKAMGEIGKSPFNLVTM
jgi:cyclic pyranopterin phosphate synthase